MYMYLGICQVVLACGCADKFNITSIASSSTEDKHEHCRHRVCVMCYRKGHHSLSAADISSIQEFIIDNYIVKDPDFPAAHCNGCYMLLSAVTWSGQQTCELRGIKGLDFQRNLLIFERSHCVIQVA